jgi:beta-lactamase regulating signal transducer with metallopeptidase domain
MNWLGSSLPVFDLLLALTAKVTIILGLSWMIAGVLRGQSAAQRHRVWAAGILGVLVLPLLTMLIPPRYSSALGNTATHWVARAGVATGTLSNALPWVAVRHVPAPWYSNLPYVVTLIWALGFSFLALKLLAGFVRLARICAGSRPLLGVEWTCVAAQLRESFDVKRPVRILRSTRPMCMPVAWGVLHPRIIVSSNADGWSQDRRRIVLAHELAHVGRQDWLLQMCAELLCCAYWFHPLAWIAARKLRRESEQACDDAVLNSGIPAPDYAMELLELARTLASSGRRWATALAIVCSSDLERRFKAMLNVSINRSRVSWRAKLMVAAVALCVLVPLAAIHVPAQNQSPESSGAPRGWFLAGTKSANYLTGVDQESMYEGHPSAYLKAGPSATEGFGTLMQSFSAAQYVGKRVRFSAAVKSEDVNDWAGLWMRVDSGPVPAVAFDNMQDRPIKGTSDWQNYQVVLDVPKDATGIAFGVLLSKSGAVWLSSVKFETVGTDVPTTGRVIPPPPPLPQGPTNLNFENQ